MHKRRGHSGSHSNRKHSVFSSLSLNVFTAHLCAQLKFIFTIGVCPASTCTFLFDYMHLELYASVSNCVHLSHTSTNINLMQIQIWSGVAHNNNWLSQWNTMRRREKLERKENWRQTKKEIIMSIEWMFHSYSMTRNEIVNMECPFKQSNNAYSLPA